MPSAPASSTSLTQWASSSGTPDAERTSSVRRSGSPGRVIRSTPGALGARAAPWRPWRAYAVQHLWAVGDHPINHLPTTDRGAAA